MRTSNNVFALKKLIKKSFSKEEKLFCCFVDFSKALDRVLRQGLLHKLECYGVNGKMLHSNEGLYTKAVNRILVNKYLSGRFQVNMGVKQGDPLSSFLFNVEMNETYATLAIDQSVDTPMIKNKKIPCLLWADDVVLISKSETGPKIVERNLKNIAINGKKL